MIAISLALIALGVASWEPARRWLRPPLEALGILDRREETRWYRSRIEAFGRSNRQLVAPCTVLLGDSLVEQLPPAYVASLWVPRGISGDRVRDLASRLSVSVLETSCSDVVVMAGSNDLVHDGSDPELVAAELSRIVTTLRNAGARVLLSTIPPTRDRYARASPSIRRTNYLIRKLGVPVVDSFAALADGSHELAAEFTTDGLHFSDSGYAAWTALLRQRLDESLPRRTQE